MSERESRFERWSASARPRSGTGRLILAFLLGGLFTFVPVFSFYMGRETALRGAPAPASADASRPADRIAPVQSAFASRLSYELSRVPAEPARRKATADAPAPKVPAPAAPGESAVSAAPPAAVEQPASPSPVTAKPGVSAATPPAAKPEVLATAPSQPNPPQDRAATRAPEERQPLPRVVNARPISATPPDPRDTTRAIEEEARTPQYRSFAPKVIEGREIRESDLAKPPAAARPIGGTASDSSLRTSPAEPAGKGGEVKAVAAAPSAKAVPQNASASISIDDVEGRIAATRDWLASAPESTHTIQLMGTSNDEQLRAQLKMLSKLLDPQKIHVFRTVAQGKPSATVVYGDYPDRRSALQALEKLPEAVAVNKPVLRTVNGIRREQKQHGLER